MIAVMSFIRDTPLPLVRIRTGFDASDDMLAAPKPCIGVVAAVDNGVKSVCQFGGAERNSLNSLSKDWAPGLLPEAGGTFVPKK